MALVVGAAPIAEATMVKKFDLGQLCQRSQMIIRGKVLSMKNTTVSVGGGELPAVTYYVAVNETLKGTTANFVEKDGKQVAVITMLASKPVQQISNNVVRFSKLPELPSFEVGEEYLLMMTGPSSVGLQMTVVTGQGCFHINPKTGMAANAFNNKGLSATIDAPIAYGDLASAVRAAVGQ
ncbi:MAG: hypothetical protein AAF449_10800 [Myxococcota bacterium]